MDKQLIAGVMVAAVAVYLAVQEDVWASSKGSFRSARTTRSLAVGWGTTCPAVSHSGPRPAAAP